MQRGGHQAVTTTHAQLTRPRPVEPALLCTLLPCYSHRLAVLHALGWDWRCGRESGRSGSRYFRRLHCIAESRELTPHCPPPVKAALIIPLVPSLCVFEVRALCWTLCIKKLKLAQNSAEPAALVKLAPACRRRGVRRLIQHTTSAGRDPNGKPFCKACAE